MLGLNFKSPASIFHNVSKMLKLINILKDIREQWEIPKFLPFVWINWNDFIKTDTIKKAANKVEPYTEPEIVKEVS